MVLVNKIRVLGSDEWSDSKVTRLFMREYKEKDKGLVRMIRDRDDYEAMTPHQLFVKIQQHESEEAPTKSMARDSNALVANDHNHSKKASLKITADGECNHSRSHKNKVVVESSSDEQSSSDDDDENAAMFIKSLKRLVRGGERNQRKGRRR